MRWCTQITDAAFVHLAGIHTLDMSYCNQHTITDVGLLHLGGIKILKIYYCDQPTITFASVTRLSRPGTTVFVDRSSKLKFYLPERSYM
jgi:hypothetical protein